MKPLDNTRILFLMGNNRISGSERGNVQVAKILKENGADVLFYTASWGNLYFHDFLQRFHLPFVIGKFGGGAHNLKKNWWKVLKFMWLSFWDLKNVEKTFKPTHLHLGAEIYFLELLPFLLFSKAKIVFRLGDKPLTHSFFHHFMWKHVYLKRANYFVCISEFIRSELEKLGKSNNKITKIFNFPPERNIKIKFNSFIKSEKEIIISYIGLISNHKGIELIIDAAIVMISRNSKLKFLIAGQYHEDEVFYQKLQQKIEKHQLADNIIFLNFIEDIPGLLTITDLHLVPSIFEEPLSNVVSEAKKAGVPSIVFPSGGLPELIQHKIDGYITKDKTTESLVEGITYFLENQDVIPQASKAAQASLHKLGIDRENFQKKWIEVYTN